MWPRCSCTVAKRRLVGENVVVVVVGGKPECDFTQQRKEEEEEVLIGGDEITETLHMRCNERALSL